MEYSKNFNFALPSRDNDVDLADINEIANNFRKIDENATKKQDFENLKTEVEDARVSYNGTVYPTLGEALRSQATDIVPLRLHLSGDAWKGETVETSFVSNKYYELKGENDLPLEYVTTNGFGMVTFPCVSGEKYLIYYGNNINTADYRRFFVPLKDDGSCAVNAKDVTNYVEVYDSENYVYLFTIPENATNLYFTTRNQSTKIEKVYGYYNIEWLKLKESNFPDGCVPFSALQGETIPVSYKYGNCIAKPLNYGSSLVVFGDSIAYGVKSPDLSITKSFIQQFAESKGLSFNNRAISGSTITDDDSQYTIYKRVTTLTYSGDTIVVAGGVNDYTSQKPIGIYDSTDVTTFYGALRGICSHLQTNYPNATVIFITPIATTRKPTAEETTPLNVYRNAIFEVATEYGFNVVDGLQMNFPDEKGNYHDYMMTDGVHPTVAGHKLYANSLMGILS